MIKSYSTQMLFIGLFGLTMPAPAETIAVKGETVFTMAGEPIENGIVLIEDHSIVRVGPSSEVTIPDGARVLTAAFVTPGLIDAHSTVGFSGILNQDHDQEQLEKSNPIQPELRAVDGYNGRDPLVDWVRSFGVTTIHTGHAPGALVSGQTMIVKTHPSNLDQALVKPLAMIAATLGPGSLSEKPDKAPGTNPKAVAMLRAELIKAGEYGQKVAKADDEKTPDRNLRLEVLGRVLDGELPLLITVNRHQDILAAIRLADEFGIRLVLDGVADAPLVLEQIKESAFPVIVHPTMARASGERENLSMETALKLNEAGVPFAFQSGYESYVPKTRVVLFEAAIAAANGLSFEDTLAALTIESARLLEIDSRVGSLEVGKDADLALFDGDPFEYTTHCIGVIASGAVTDSEPR